MGLFDGALDLSGLGGGFLDDLTGKSQEKQAKGSFKQGLKANKGEYQSLSNFFAKYMQQLQGGQATLAGGYDSALSGLARTGQAGRQGIMDQQRQGLGAIQSGLGRSGLLNTTVSGNLQRGVMSDSQKSLWALNEALAQAKAGLQVGRGQALAAGQGNIGAGFLQQYAALHGLNQDKINLLLGKGTVPQGGIGAYAGGMIPGLLGGLIGG